MRVGILMTPLHWRIVDRANLIWFIAFLIGVILGGWLVLAEVAPLPGTAVSLMCGLQAWRLGVERHLEVTIDDTGITTRTGDLGWHRDFEAITAARLLRRLGTWHLILATSAVAPRERTFSNQLWGFARVARNELALQVPPLQVELVSALIADRGWSDRPQQ